MYTCQFLARLFPFTSCTIELQGNGFDIPDRQFLSLESTFLNCTTQTTDVRELIPEFFYLPEMFSNINKLDFGKTMQKEQVKHVQLPIWADNNPFKFVIQNRKRLESEQVSEMLNYWVDLIFGSKQKGKEAELSTNIFCKYTYENEINIDEVREKDYDEYEALLQKIEFGQTPSQIIKKALKLRNPKNLNKECKNIIHRNNELKKYRSTSESINQYRNRSEIINNMIVKIKSLEDDKLMLVYNNGDIKTFK